MNKSKLVSVFVLLVGPFFLMACDPDGKKKCQWFIMPNTEKVSKVDKGFIPVCARNLDTLKEDCRLQTKLAFAKKVYGKKFRYVDLKVKSYALPRTIDEIKFCE